MCLESVEAVFDPPVVEEREGWKAVNVRDSAGSVILDARRLPTEAAGLSTCCVCTTRVFEFNRWYADIQSEQRQILADDNKLYPIGFHAFVSRDDAEAWSSNCCQVAVRVRCRKILASGKQSSIDGASNCFVAREIMFLPPDGWQIQSLAPVLNTWVSLAVPLPEETACA